MDSLTQIVLGAAVGEVVLGRKLGNRAVLWGGIAGTIPDLDVLMKPLYDAVTNIEVHRGLTHSLLFWVLGALVFGYFVFKNEKATLSALTVSVFGILTISSSNFWVWIIVPMLILGLLYLIWKVPIKTKASQRDWTMLFFWGFSTHALLDACTTWGTKLLWPFDYKFAFNNIFVADPLYTLPFLVLLIMAMFRKRGTDRRAKMNRIALYVSSGYMALTFVLKANAAYQFSSALEAQKIEYLDLDTKPSPLNTVLWYALVESEDSFYTGYYSIFDSQEIHFNPPIHKGHELLKDIEDLECIQQLNRIAGKWHYVTQESDSTLIYYDMRFGQFGFKEDAPFLWQYRIHLNCEDCPKVERVPFDPSGSMKGIFSALGKRIGGN
jgi:inner membrane protein